MTSDLAHVEVASALAALHRRFCDTTRFPPPPGTSKRTQYREGSLVQSAAKRAAARDALYNHLVGKVTKARERSLQMSACEEISDIGKACIRYRDWLDYLIGGNSSDVEYDAAHACVKDARELVSIVAIARAYPESAAKRAKAIADGTRRRSSSRRPPDAVVSV